MKSELSHYLQGLYSIFSGVTGGVGVGGPPRVTPSWRVTPDVKLFFVVTLEKKHWINGMGKWEW